MEINTDKIKKEMKRQGLTYAQVGDRCTPQMTRQGVWDIIRKAQTLGSINKIAQALGYDDPRDLIEKD